MQRALLVLVAVAVWKDATAALLRATNSATKNEAPVPKAYRQEMENTGDAQYTGVIKVGGQPLKAVFDTGSFELLVLSANCSVCGTVSHLYNDSWSDSYKGTNFNSEHSFGSGTTNSVEAFDALEIGETSVKKQVFWEVYDANMALLLEDTFQAILGIGPPVSAIKFAKEDAAEVHNELAEFKKNGHTITDSIKDTVKHYDELLTHAEDATSVVQNLELRNMSVCLGKKSLSPGYMIWNDRESRNHPEKFTQVKVVGEYYWSAEMTNVKLGAAFGEQEEQVLGCTSETCTAVVDTGTTLMVAPGDVVQRVNDILEDWRARGGSCEDLSKLPDLHFTLDGHSFSLPPESYVGRIDGELSAVAGRYLPHILERQQNKEQKWGGDCEALLMKMDMDSQDGPLWILGMPLFRKYYTSFQFEQALGSTPQAKTMSFSVADDTCQPTTQAEAAAAERLIRTKTRKAELRVNASKIRMPRLVHRAVEEHRFGKIVSSKPFLPV